MPESDDAFCPWCLRKDRPINFMSSGQTQDGELAAVDNSYLFPKKHHQKMLRCPECKVQFRSDSLFRMDDTLEHYVRFLLSYPWRERQQKMNWDKVKQRLRDMNLANDFWELWYKLKPEYMTEKVV